MSDLRPDLKAVVQIVLAGQDQRLPSRVESVAEEYLDLLAPRQSAAWHLEPGQVMDLFWGEHRGLYQQSFRLMATVRVPRLLWRVESIAPVEKHQRRRYTRAGVTLDAEIIFVSRNPKLRLDGLAVDISEAGLRCRTKDQIFLVDGESVEVRFPNNDSIPTVVGLVLRKDSVRELFEFAVVLPEPVPDEVADAFRREVFRAQRRHLRESEV